MLGVQRPLARRGQGKEGQQAAMRATFPTDVLSPHQSGGKGLLTNGAGVLNPQKKK